MNNYSFFYLFVNRFTSVQPVAKQKLWKSLYYRDGKIISGYDRSEWILGKWRTNPYPVVRECEGLNCCPHIVDAIGYIPGVILAEVEVRGKQLKGDDKITAQDMKLIRAWKWTKEDSIAMAIYAAELVIGYYEKEYPNEKNPRKSIEAAKAYLANPTQDNADYAYFNAARSARLAPYHSNAFASVLLAASYTAESARVVACASDAVKAAIGVNDCQNLKIKIDEWIIARLETCEQMQ